MRYWLFGTFIIVFAATSLYTGIVLGADLGAVIGAAGPVWLLTLVTTLGVYALYQRLR
jgi:hypothetical protein